MRGSWRIGRIMGIDISIDPSWFVIVFLMIYSLGFIEFPRELHPRSFFPRVDIVSITLGVAASLLLFASVLVHELSHSWMALQRGIPVASITLFIFGGVAQISDEPDRPATEFLIAIMGPLASLALATVFGAAWLWLRILDTANALDFSLLPLILLTGILFQANGALALFNLAPGFPLDGGRVFRAILWAAFRDIRRATRWATRAGQAIALILIGVGGWCFISQLNGGGIWYTLIGFFLWNAAGEGYRQTVVREMLRGVRVSQLMTRSIETVSPDLALVDFVTQHVLPRREQTFAVSDGSTLQGIISTAHIQCMPHQEWITRRVRDVMTPRSNLEALAPQQTAAAALVRLSRGDAEELPVMDAGQLIGFLGRSELSRFLRLKFELKEQ
jgi:Zn-dependent protease